MGIFDFFKWKPKRDKETNEKVQAITIDVSSEMDKIQKGLIKSYKEICLYPEIMQIPEKDRLPLLKYVWGQYAYRIEGVLNQCCLLFSQYDKTILEFIVKKEMWRVNVLLHQEKMLPIIKEYPFAQFEQFLYNDKYIFNEKGERKENKDYKKKLCLCTEIHKVFKVWREADGKINRYDFMPYIQDITEKDLKKIWFWIDGEIKKISKEEYINLLERNGCYDFVKLKLKKMPAKQIMLRHMLECNGIKVNEDVILTEKEVKEMLLNNKK